MKREVVLIDGANNHACCMLLGFSMDYAKLLKLFPDLLRAYYFTALPPKNVESSIRPTTDYLSYNGYTLIQKESKIYQNEGMDKPKIKGNMDCEMILTAVDLVQYITHMHLFTGDGDFSALVAWVKARGVHVTVWSSIQTDPPMIANTLRREADVFRDINSIRTNVKQDALNSPKTGWRK